MTTARKLPGPIFLRLAELGPPAEPPGAVSSWCLPLVRELPAYGLVVQTPPPRPQPRMPARERQPAPRLITDAQARGLVGATARAVLDVLGGRQPLTHLGTLLNNRALASVHAMLRGGLRWPVRHATVASVHIFLPDSHAVEASVVFHCQQRHRALALRMEHVRRRWVGTAVRVG